MKRSIVNLIALVSCISAVSAPIQSFAAAIRERAVTENTLKERDISNVAPLITDRLWINVVLARVNHYRAPHAAVPFVWKPTQAQFAQEQANKCLLQHSGGKYGKNIYWISFPSIDFTQQTIASFDGWMSEQLYYSSIFV